MDTKTATPTPRTSPIKPAAARKPAAPSPAPTVPASSASQTSEGPKPVAMDDELSSVNFPDILKTVEDVMKKLHDEPSLQEPCHSLPQKADAKIVYDRVQKALNEVTTKLSQAEHSLRRRKVVNEEAVQKVDGLKKFTMHAHKIVSWVNSSNAVKPGNTQSAMLI